MEGHHGTQILAYFGELACPTGKYEYNGESHDEIELCVDTEANSFKQFFCDHFTAS